jgi:hypothetical protein
LNFQVSHSTRSRFQSERDPEDDVSSDEEAFPEQASTSIATVFQRTVAPPARVVPGIGGSSSGASRQPYPRSDLDGCAHPAVPPITCTGEYDKNARVRLRGLVRRENPDNVTEGDLVVKDIVLFAFEEEEHIEENCLPLGIAQILEVSVDKQSAKANMMLASHYHGKVTTWVIKNKKSGRSKAWEFELPKSSIVLLGCVMTKKDKFNKLTLRRLSEIESAQFDLFAELPQARFQKRIAAIRSCSLAAVGVVSSSDEEEGGEDGGEEGGEEAEVSSDDAEDEEFKPNLQATMGSSSEDDGILYTDEDDPDEDSDNDIFDQSIAKMAEVKKNKKSVEKAKGKKVMPIGGNARKALRRN